AEQPGHPPEAPGPPPPRPVARRDRTMLRLCVVPLRTIGEDRDDGLAIGLAEEISAVLEKFISYINLLRISRRKRPTNQSTDLSSYADARVRTCGGCESRLREPQPIPTDERVAR